jgi:hypothetical protein
MERSYPPAFELSSELPQDVSMTAEKTAAAITENVLLLIFENVIISVSPLV